MLDVTVIRPSLVYGRDSSSVFGRLVAMIRRLPLVPIVGAGTYALAPIYVGDVIAAVQRCLRRPSTREVALSGPERVSYKEFLRRIALGARGPPGVPAYSLLKRQSTINGNLRS